MKELLRDLSAVAKLAAMAALITAAALLLLAECGAA